MFSKKTADSPINPPDAAGKRSFIFHSRTVLAKSRFFSVCIMLLLLVCCVCFILILGALAAWLLPAWTDTPVQIVLVLLAFYLMGKLIDFVFGPETFSNKR